MPDTDRTTPAAASGEAPGRPLAAPGALRPPHELPAPSIGPLPPLAWPGMVGPATLLRHEPQHGAYLAASGTLTQFNALIVAILTPALAAIERPLLRAAIGVALVAHTCAALLLCGAARPTSTGNGASGEEMAADTFRSYRRGWRVTMLAMLLSVIALAVFSFETLGAGPLLRSLLAR